MGFLNAAMLLGLVAVAIPPIIHLLNRRRYEVIDWGAMQFLQVSEVTRRRILIEEILLMALRMGLIAVLVLALAQPFSNKPLLPSGGTPSRDVVLILDGSASMSLKTGDQTVQEKAQEWATRFIRELKRGDGVAVILAREHPVRLVGKPIADRERVIERLQKLPAPGGAADLARAVRAAHDILDGSQRAERDIILVSDGQKQGWADARRLEGWQDVKERRRETSLEPKLWYANLDPERPRDVANWSLAPLTSTRAIVGSGQRLQFRSAIQPHGSARYDQPFVLRGELNGKKVVLLNESGKPFELPEAKSWKGGQIPLDFQVQGPDQAGSYVFSLVLETAGDRLEADNRRSLALEVLPAVPVLIVDGDEKRDATHRGSDALRDVLAPKTDISRGDPPPMAKVKVVSVSEFSSAHLLDQNANGRDGEEKPRVIILSNVAKLSPLQQQVIDTFLREGGGVLATLGGRAENEIETYNTQYFRDGKGWFPAKLEKMEGAQDQPTMGVRLLAETFYHPALEECRRPGYGIDDARSARWWKMTPPEKEEDGVVIARFDREDAPFLIEGRRGEGRIIVSSVPLDESWRGNLVEVYGYVPLVHELVYYLASARTGDQNPQPGRSLRFRLPRDASPEGLTLKAPSDEQAKPLVIGGEDDEKQYGAKLESQAQGPLLIHEGLFESGTWELKRKDGGTTYYVVQADGREADLTPADEEDLKRVGEQVPVKFKNDPSEMAYSLSQEENRQEFWWWFLLGVVLLLCSEVWLTRRIVKSRA